MLEKGWKGSTSLSVSVCKWRENWKHRTNIFSWHTNWQQSEDRKFIFYLSEELLTTNMHYVVKSWRKWELLLRNIFGPMNMWKWWFLRTPCSTQKAQQKPSVVQAVYIANFGQVLFLFKTFRSLGPSPRVSCSLSQSVCLRHLKHFGWEELKTTCLGVSVCNSREN